MTTLPNNKIKEIKSKNIAICGLACAGKTVAMHMLKGTFLDIKFAKPHYDVLKILGQEKNRLFMQEFSDLAKKYFGENIFVKIFENTTTQHITKLVCDDLRYKIEFDYCLKNDWTIIYIDTDEDIRKKRSDELDIEWNPNHNSEQSHLFKEQCHYIIENNKTLDILKNKIDLLFK